MNVDIEKLEALAKAATPQNFDSAEEKAENGYIECPHCGGNGEVELEADYCNYDNSALGVQFYGIGGEFGAAEDFYRAANPAAVLEMTQTIRDLQFSVAGLKTDYETYERVNAELRAECEALRRRVDDMSPFKGAPKGGQDMKCLACGDYHYGLSGLPCPKMSGIAYSDINPEAAQ